MKIMPGVRLNFNKDSVGMSFGVPGARYTINSKGRRTVTTGFPGTGLYNVETLSSGTRSRSSRSQETYEEAPTPTRSGPPAPGFFAGPAEHALNKFMLDIYNYEHPDTAKEIIEKATALRAKYPKLSPVLECTVFLHGILDSETKEQARTWGQAIWDARETIFSDKFVVKYLDGITPSTQITRGIFTNLKYNKQLFGFIWAEVLQNQEKYTEALEVLNQMEPDQMVAISIADIENTMGDYDAAIETTEDIENEDDATAMLLVLRGIAFREKKLNEAALECFKRALANKKRSEGLLHRALFERAETYARMNKKAMAIKDLERILVDEPA
jgi:tetratricopeptide (TPR) repeat protein